MDFEDRHVPTAVYACRRNGQRHRCLYAKDAFIEFTSSDGRPWRLDLLDYGSGGLCFGLEDGKPVLGRGARLDAIVVHIGSLAIAGALTIAHATEEFAAGTICGARFDPATEADARKFAAAIAALGR